MEKPGVLIKFNKKITRKTQNQKAFRKRERDRTLITPPRTNTSDGKNMRIEANNMITIQEENETLSINL